MVEIAIRHLSQPAKEQIEALTSRRVEALVDLSVWADYILLERPETDPWHSVDIPHDGGGYNRARDCDNANCVVEKVVEFARMVGDARLSRSERTEALKFLIHLVGDLHVPLHAYAPGTPDDLWKGWAEWVGPWVQIGERISLLHTWWDWHFVARLGSGSRDIADRLSAQINALDRQTWAQGTPADWANESFAIARAFILEHGLIDPVRLAGNSRASPIVLHTNVLDEASAIAAQRLKMAGVRLAWLLNRTLG